MLGTISFGVRPGHCDHINRLLARSCSPQVPASGRAVGHAFPLLSSNTGCGWNLVTPSWLPVHKPERSQQVQSEQRPASLVALISFRGSGALIRQYGWNRGQTCWSGRRLLVALSPPQPGYDERTAVSAETPTEKGHDLAPVASSAYRATPPWAFSPSINMSRSSCALQFET